MSTRTAYQYIWYIFIHGVIYPSWDTVNFRCAIWKLSTMHRPLAKSLDMTENHHGQDWDSSSDLILSQLT